MGEPRVRAMKMLVYGRDILSDETNMLDPLPLFDEVSTIYFVT